MGIFYIPFIILVILGTSNAVNLTDGLDGLATGLIAISTLVFGAIAYATGRFDFSNYLNIMYLPGTGELFIFCLAMVGACIGFLWYNAHPATVFMGDTGSLALGAALGTLAVLVKKEILLILIGGVFVAESLSVMLQIYYFKSLIPLAGVLLIIQGVSECMRCILCIRNNQWLKRHEDVRETEEDLIKQQQEEQRRKAALGKENK